VTPSARRSSYYPVPVASMQCTRWTTQQFCCRKTAAYLPASHDGLLTSPHVRTGTNAAAHYRYECVGCFAWPSGASSSSDNYLCVAHSSDVECVHTTPSAAYIVIRTEAVTEITLRFYSSSSSSSWCGGAQPKHQEALSALSCLSSSALSLAISLLLAATSRFATLMRPASSSSLSLRWAIIFIAFQLKYIATTTKRHTSWNTGAGGDNGIDQNKS
jgi:hypothetical protein